MKSTPEANRAEVVQMVQITPEIEPTLIVIQRKFQANFQNS